MKRVLLWCILIFIPLYGCNEIKDNEEQLTYITIHHNDTTRSAIENTYSKLEIISEMFINKFVSYDPKKPQGSFEKPIIDKTKNVQDDNQDKPVQSPPQNDAPTDPPPQETHIEVISNLDDLLILVNKGRKLPREFVPEQLVIPNVPFSFEGYDEKKQMHKTAAEALEKLFELAYQEGIELYARSGYRSYNRQKTIFNYNAKKYGEKEANTYSAKPGHSEHQTGLAMDITAVSVAFKLNQSFGDTIEGKWLANNVATFGFIIRYPKQKEEVTGYIYEPWHIRYVGIEAATEIMTNGITLEEYLTSQY
jgi:zinc D-Ala-D-Ala carboxypeptidase